jgi:16S rRNA processing protein RimM
VAEKKSAVSRTSTAKAAPKPAPAKAASAPRRGEPTATKKDAGKPVKAPVVKAAPKPAAAKTAKAPAAKVEPKVVDAKKAAPPAAPAKPSAKAAPKKPEVKADPKVAKAKAAAPAPKAAAPTKGKKQAVEAKAPAKPEKPAKAPPAKAEKVAKPEKPAKPAKAEKPPKPPKPEKPPKPPKLAPVAAAFAKPMPAKPLAVAAGRAQPILRGAPIVPLRAPPKPLTAPKPVEQPEVIGELQPVPNFKPKAGAANKGMVLVGAIAGAFGVKGEVRLRAFTTKPDGVIAYGPLFDEHGKALLTPKSWRSIKEGVAVVAPEVKTKEQADKLRGKKLFVPRANLPKTAEDEYYVVDLLGSRAESLDGTILGEITAVWNFGAGDVLEYRPPNGGPNVRITFSKEAVPHVDLANKRVVLDPPPPEPEAK